MPRKVKYRKMQRGRIRGLASRGSRFEFGDYGLKSMAAGLISARQIESARRTITRYLKRGGEVWIRIFPDKPITKKPAESRMGKGKGGVDHFSAKIFRGTMLFEIGGVPEKIGKEALRLAAYKLPLKTRVVVKV